MIKRRCFYQSILLAICLLPLLAVDNFAQTKRKGDKQKSVAAQNSALADLKEFDQRWQQAATKRNADAMARLYTIEAVWLPPNDKRMTGRNLIRDFYQKIFLEPTLSLVHTPSKHVIAASGDVAIEYGVYDFQMKTPTGEMRDTGKYMFYFAKEKGEWKIAADIFNSDAPAPASK